MPKLRTLTALLLLAFVAAALSAGGGWEIPDDARGKANPTEPTKEGLAASKARFDKKCAPCHGISGDGRGKIAVRMGFTAAAFTDAERMRAQTDGEMFFKLSEGRDSMPSFRTKIPKEEDRWRMVNYLRTFAAKTDGGGE